MLRQAITNAMKQVCIMHWKEPMDGLQMWLNERTAPAEAVITPGKDLFIDFAIFATSKRWHPGTARTFYARLRDKDLISKRTMRGIHFIGIRLRFNA